MRRVFVVVATFVALNTGGFWAYRAIQPEPAAASVPAASDETFSRSAVSIQPKPTETASEVVPEPVERAPAKTFVSAPTPSPRAEPEEEKSVPRAPTRRAHHAPAIPAQKPKAQESRPVEKSNAGIQKSALEMDDNPYKRGE